MFVLLKFKMSNVKIRSSGVKREWCPAVTYVKDDNSFTSVKLFMNNKYSAVDILCRPGPSTLLTSEDDRGIRRCFWMGGADLVVAILHVPIKVRGAGGMVSEINSG